MATKTLYEGELYSLQIHDSRMVDSNQPAQMLTYTIEPELNYLATQYNDSFFSKDEKAMATPYSEMLQNEELEEIYQQMPIIYPIETGTLTGGLQSNVTLAQDQPTTFNILNGGNIDAGEPESLSGDASPRQIFLGGIGSVLTRDEDYFDSFSNILLFDPSYRGVANVIAKQFPQYVRIAYNGMPLKPQNVLKNFITTDPAALYSLIADFVINRQFNEDDGSQARSDFFYGPIITNTDAQGVEVTTQASLRSWLFYENIGDDETSNSLLQDQTYWNQETDPYIYVNPVSLEVMSPNRESLFSDLTTIVKNENSATLPSHRFLFFKVEKYNTQGLVQTFWTTTLSEDGSGFEILDTQVKVGFDYTYKCFGYWLQHRKDQEARLFEVPMFTQACKIEQPSLPRPQVQFVNVKDSKNKIKIVLNQSSNSENLEFYELNPGEKLAFEERRALYDLRGKKDAFVYETDKGRYEIYKMTKQPEMGSTDNPYQNIVNNSTKIDIEGKYDGTLAYYIDKIKPFKKYYYVFRCINNYSYPSNPTAIWEVELTKDANETFLHSNVVGFANPNQNKYMLTKTMMRMFQVVPSINQTSFDPDDPLAIDIEEPIYDDEGREAFGYVNELGETVIVGYKDPNGLPQLLDIFADRVDAADFQQGGTYNTQFLTINNTVDSLSVYNSNNNQLPDLGTAEEKIWTTKDHHGNIKSEGKRFKIRLVSKDTGRKIDFNFRFILNKNYNNS